MGLFYKISSVSFVDSWFSYGVMEYGIGPLKVHLLLVIFTIRLGQNTSVR